MAENSAISWTTHTFNPWRGCTKVSPACKLCYADRQAKRNPATLGIWGDNGTRVVASEAMWKQPIKWDKEAAAKGVRYRVFCASMADVFESWTGLMVNSKGQALLKPYLDSESQPENWVGEYRDMDGKLTGDLQGWRPVTMGDVRRRLFKLIDSTPNLDWLLLTKRPEDIKQMWPAVEVESQRQADDYNERGELYRRNVWLGTTAESQRWADQRVLELLACDDYSDVLFASCEPLLGPVDLMKINHTRLFEIDALNGWSKGRITRGIKPIDPKLSWVIAGGESGAGARPSHPKWFHSLRDQCEATGVPFHFKQWGEWEAGVKTPYDQLYGASQFRPGLYHDFGDEWMALKVGVERAGRLLNGQLYDQFPKGVLA